MAVLFIFIDQMPFLTPTLDNADLLIALVMTRGFHLHHVEATDQTKDDIKSSKTTGQLFPDTFVNK